MKYRANKIKERESHIKTSEFIIRDTELELKKTINQSN